MKIGQYAKDTHSLYAKNHLLFFELVKFETQNYFLELKMINVFAFLSFICIVVQNHNNMNVMRYKNNDNVKIIVQRYLY